MPLQCMKLLPYLCELTGFCITFSEKSFFFNEFPIPSLKPLPLKFLHLLVCDANPLKENNFQKKKNNFQLDLKESLCFMLIDFKLENYDYYTLLKELRTGSFLSVFFFLIRASLDESLANHLSFNKLLFFLVIL